MITFELFDWIDELFRSRSLIKKYLAACVVVALLYEEYGFKNIITNMKLPKAILEKYNVEFDETMKR